MRVEGVPPFFVLTGFTHMRRFPLRDLSESERALVE